MSSAETTLPTQSACVKQAVTLIAKRQIPNIQITY